MAKKLSKILCAILAVAMISCIFAGCTNTAVNSENTSGEDTSNGPVSGDVYTVGICQLVQHDALDAATNGFMDALEEKLGDKIQFNLQNAAGDSATCSTITTQFVADDVDLILANATPALQAALAATDSTPIVATSITDFATALDIADWNGCTGINVTGTSDLMPIPTQAAMFSEILPEAKTIGIVYCSAEANSKYQVDTICAEFDKLNIEFDKFSAISRIKVVLPAPGAEIINVFFIILF